MIEIIAAAIKSIGPIAGSELLLALAGEDRDRARAELQRLVPHALAISRQETVRRELIGGACALVELVGARSIVFLNYDLAALEALQAAAYEGDVTIVPSDDISADDLGRKRANTPRGLDIEIAEPGWAPLRLDPRKHVVVAYAFDAGSGYALVQAQTARLLKMIAGMPFVGDVVGWRPLRPISPEQPDGWVTRSEYELFRYVASASGIEATASPTR